MQEILQLLTNKIAWSVFLAWLTSFLIKLALNYRKRGFSKELFYATGGMPSSHVAFATALSLSIGLSQGFNSAIFIVAVAFTVIIVHDAINIRAKVDKRLQEISKKFKLKNSYDYDFIGHNINEVLLGAAIGIIITLLVFFL